MVAAPGGTPYDSGLFQFDIYCPPQYPDVPPRVNLMTTGRGTVRFNPNLYPCGNVRRCFLLVLALFYVIYCYCILHIVIVLVVRFVGSLVRWFRHEVRFVIGDGGGVGGGPGVVVCGEQTRGGGGVGHVYGGNYDCVVCDNL